MKRIFTIAILGLLFNLTAVAQITWTKKTGPYGGFVGDIVVHPTNFTLYAVSNPNNYNGGPLYRSTDNGATWTEQGTSVFSGDAGHFVDVLMLPNGTIYALSYYQCCSSSAGNNLYKSTDDGATWTKLNTGNGSAAGGFDNPSQVAYNSFSGTIYVFGRDNGSPYNYRVYRSLNGGATFSKTYGDLNGDFTNISITSTGDVYAQHYMGTYNLAKSNDDGVTFTAVSMPDLSSVVDLTAKSDGSELVMVTNGNNMYYLASPFTTWNPIGETWFNPLTDNASYGNAAVLGYSIDNATLYLLDNAHNKIYSGTSTTLTWTQKGTSLVNANGDNATCFAAKDANVFYAGTNDIGVWKTINGGSGWNETDIGIEAGNYNSIVTADNGNIVVAGTRIQTSTDQGATWTRIANVPNNGPNYALFKATTGSPATIVAISQSGSYKSTDNGVTWASTTSGPSNAYQFASTDGTNIAAWGNNSFYYTHTQGTTWSAALSITGTGWPSGSYSLYSNALAVDGTNGVIYCYLYDAGYKFFKIQLNSTTAPTFGTATLIDQTKIGSSVSMNAIAFLNGKLYASWYGNSGPGNLSYSSDGGANWTNTSNVNAGKIDVDPINNYLFVTGSNGQSSYTINLSRDGGTTFTSSSVNTNSNSNFYGINLSASGVAYAGFTNSSIFATTNTVVTPLAPTSLVSAGAGADRLTLRWVDNSSNESYFLIQKFNGTSYDSIGNVGNASSTGTKLYFEAQKLAANTSYTFRVSAVNAAGSSSVISITTSTINSCASSIPDNHSWNGSVAWSNSSPASGTTSLTNALVKSLGDGYYSVSDVSNGAVTGGSGTNITATFFESCNSTYLLPNYPLEPNTDGTWTSGTNTIVLKYITAQYVSPETTATVTLTMNGTDPTPGAPSNTTAYIYNNSSIEVSWAGSSFETQYIVERSSVDNTFSSIDKTYTVNYPTTSVIDNSGITVGVTYYYRVKAKNGTGTSAASNTATIQFAKPYFALSGTTIESTVGYSTTGAIWGDFNNDGFDDLIMPQITFSTNTPTVPMAFKNDGAGNFVAVTPTGIVMSSDLVATAADYDNDGKLDLFLTSISSQNYLYKGNGDFTFSLVASTPVSENNNLNGIESADLGASWVDYDNNGLVDLYVLTQDNTLKAKLFSQGPVGTFTKQTTGALPSVMAQASLSAWADYDNDGDQDVFITDGGSGATNELFKNNGDGTFTRITAAPFDDSNHSSFTAAWGDYNNDGNLDLFIGSKTNSLLYKNNGDGTFTKQLTGIVVTDVIGSNQVFGAAWGDINNDGYQDLLISIAGAESRIYINNNGTAFTKVVTEKFNDIKVARFGVAFSDYNKDGLLDIASSIIDPALLGGGSGMINGPTVKNQLFKNNASSAGNWLEVKLTGTTSNKLAIGARVTIVAGGKTQIRELASTSAFCSQHSQFIHFGLGSSTSVTSVQVKWPSGIIQGLSNVNSNQILNISEDNTGPVASTLSPTNGVTGVNANTTLAITLNETSTATGGKFITLYKTSDLVNAVASIDVSTVTPSGNTFTFTLPQTLLPSTSYSVVIDAGAFKDIYGNPSLAMAATAWQFTTAVGPAVALLNPLNSATNVAVTTPVEITFDKAFTAVSGKKINLTIHGNSSPAFSIDVTTGTISGNKISFTLSSSLGFLTTYDVAVDAGAFKDSNSNATAAITWSFVTIDNVAPVITFTPPTTLDKNFSTTQFAVTVTDNSGTVSSATLSYRKIAGGTFTDLPGTFDAVAGKWNFVVNESFFDGNGLEFYLSAKDPSNNVGRLPLDPATDFYTYMNYKAADNVIPSQQVGFGGTASSWKIFTIPFDLGSGNAVSTVLNQLSSLTIQIDWRMLTYKNNTAWGEYPSDFSTFTRGQGYFINIKDPVNLVMPAATASANNRKNLFQMSLKKGWNQVGNPYLTAISWDDVKNFTGNTGLTGTGAVLKKFVSGSYTNQQSLAPFEGGFVLAESDVTISIPFAGQTAPGGRQGSSIAFGNDDWILPLTLVSGDVQNTFGGVGMHSLASLSYDQFDDVNAPRFIDYLEMNFAHPEYFAKDFARDVVPQANEYTWEFTVDSNVKGVTELKWDMPSNVTKDIYLYDLKRETIVNMKESNTYSLDATKSSTFRIYFGEGVASKIRPQEIFLGDASPNPTTVGKVAIPFALPESQANYQVSLEVYNSMGQKVSTLTSGSYPSGFYTSTWEPSQDLINGLYIYRLKVAGVETSSVQSKKIIVNH